MKRIQLLCCLVVAFLHGNVHAQTKEKTLYDFEDPADLKAWSNLVLPGAKDKEPLVAIELSKEHAAAGKHSLKLTFSGGNWPTVATKQVTDDWLAFPTFEA